jgi:hypothetical protein
VHIFRNGSNYRDEVRFVVVSGTADFGGEWRIAVVTSQLSSVDRSR